MKIAFPSMDDSGLESMVYGHFGSAQFFIINDTTTKEIKTVSNKDKDHIHGQCQPLAALGRNPVDAVVVGGMGAGVFSKLQAAGIKTYRAVEGTVKKNLDLFLSERLPEFTLDQTCAGHGHNGKCLH